MVSIVKNILFVVPLLVILFVPGAKALVITGLMQIGLFQPDIPASVKPVGTNAYNVTFRAANGKTLSLNSLKGKVVFVNFWATWCPPCRAEMPSINKLYTQFRSDTNVVFIMVDADSQPAKAVKYMERRKFKLPVYTVADSVPHTLFSGALPTTLIFNKQGNVAFREEGAGNYAAPKVVEFIKKLKEGR
ncbi:MAG: TlpA family protein disulfide reductase [Sphingobacteriales bacterium]|nr:MAG: TlpA family protein disulfide reductase [Sphingobacteriales bacterium]